MNYELLTANKNRHKPLIKESSNKSNELRLLSLFSGCGGLDLGFEGGFEVLINAVNRNIHPDWIPDTNKDKNWTMLPHTRFKTVFANDIRHDARTAWTTYWQSRGVESSVYHLDSIVDLVKRHQAGETIFPDNIDIVVGGFPCQDFSVSGKRLGFNSSKSHNGKALEDNAPSIENRGQLYMWMREVIAITQPKIFIAENVKGLVNLSDVKTVIENDFRSIGNDGYLVVEASVLHAADYGVSQSRERVLFIGFKKSELTKEALTALTLQKISDKYDPYPPKTHNYTTHNDNLMPYVTLRQVFAGLEEPEFSNDKAHQKYSKAKYMGKHCQGQREISLDDISPTIRSEHHGNIEYRRLSIENGGKIYEELEKELHERRLSVRECALIQTFPNDYEFIIPHKNGEKGVSASDAYKIIGNAVPPLLAYNIAKRLDDNWELYFGGSKE